MKWHEAETCIQFSVYTCIWKHLCVHVFNIAVNLNERKKERIQYIQNTTQHNNQSIELNLLETLLPEQIYSLHFFTFVFVFFFFPLFIPIFPWFAFGYSFTLSRTHTHVCVVFSVVCYSGANVPCVHNIRAFILCIHITHGKKTWNIKQVCTKT